MPRRAAPGRRDRIEAALTPALRGALEELREVLDIWDWQQSPLAPVFQHAAVLLYAGRLIEREGYSEKDAIQAASIALDIAPDTSRSRGDRWPEDSRALCTPTPQAGRPTLDEACEDTQSEAA